MENKKESGKTKPGIAFERIIADLQKQLDSGSTVTHNQRLIDKLGHSRQFDVVIRGKMGGQEMLGIIECKDYKGNVGVTTIEAFRTKSENIDANLKMVISRFGFSKKAFDVAKQHGIRTLALLKPSESEKGTSVEEYIYGRKLFWRTDNIRATAILSDGSSKNIKCSLQDFEINDYQIWDWLIVQLYPDRPLIIPGWYGFKLGFNSVVKLKTPTRTLNIASLFIKIKLDVTYLRVPAFFTGNGLVQFNPDVLHIPKAGTIGTTLSNLDFQKSEVVDKIPSGPRLFGFFTFNIWPDRTKVLPQPTFPAAELAKVSTIPPESRTKTKKRQNENKNRATKKKTRRV